jgi:hypothetical protein
MVHCAWVRAFMGCRRGPERLDRRNVAQRVKRTAGAGDRTHADLTRTGRATRFPAARLPGHLRLTATRRIRHRH